MRTTTTTKVVASTCETSRCTKENTPVDEMKLVLVTWIDALGCSSSWRDKEHLADSKPLLCRSVGWILRDDDKYIVLVPHIADETQYNEWQGCGDMTIPRGMIQKVQLLEIKLENSNG